MKHLLCLAACVPSLVTAAPEYYRPDWYRPPVLLQAGEAGLDVTTSMTHEQWNSKKVLPDVLDGNFHHERMGYAAPWMADLGRGAKDLLVGSYGGGFRIYHNTGNPDKPMFPAEYTYLKAGGRHAQVPIGCCIASNPRLADLDGDGVPDLLSGGYYNSNIVSERRVGPTNVALVYWWKGAGDGTFGSRQTIMADDGKPLYVHDDLEGLPSWANLGPTAFPVFWFSDGTAPGAMPDLVMGSLAGHIVVHRAAGKPGAPAFSRKEAFHLWLSDGKALPDADNHASITVADWDGDGLWDLLAGSESGAVYFYRNFGKPGEPDFSQRQLLIPPGKRLQLLEPGESPRRGITSYVQVIDLNNDGRTDILLGDYSESFVLRPDLKEADRHVARSVMARIDDVNAYQPFSVVRLTGDETWDAQYQQRVQELMPYVVQRHRMQSGDFLEKPLVRHGYVWMYIRK